VFLSPSMLGSTLSRARGRIYDREDSHPVLRRPWPSDPDFTFDVMLPTDLSSAGSRLMPHMQRSFASGGRTFRALGSQAGSRPRRQPGGPRP
jgi:hypothetical protein